VGHVLGDLPAEDVLGLDLGVLSVLYFGVVAKSSDLDLDILFHDLRFFFGLRWVIDLLVDGGLPLEEFHFFQHFSIVFRGVEFDDRAPLGLEDVSPDLGHVVLDVDFCELLDLISDLIGGHVVSGEAVEECDCVWLVHSWFSLTI